MFIRGMLISFYYKLFPLITSYNWYFPVNCGNKTSYSNNNNEFHEH